ncbi:hypothetical protein PILCRDRAFT_815831 [Piloderma croceum F 1598]|uniref:Uncharacterized protein n=1 Tax=Piloderma croceum (strain F 1598) TaxID=765440 RepID=A0A0C3BJS5_PILCF|nr:hypothetical protein PILCRDRAFT_815831 [Piloderma croceum F 1598]
MSDHSTFTIGTSIPTPHCHGMVEHPQADVERARLSPGTHEAADDSLSIHILHGLAYTVGSALGSTPPSKETCLAAFVAPNKVGLAAGARAWSKHSHRSGVPEPESDPEVGRRSGMQKPVEAGNPGWWGTPSGPVAMINEKAMKLFRKVMDNASWRNLHWLPHQVLVYEVRVPDGYGMRWSQNQSDDWEAQLTGEGKSWVFRGFLEPPMENGHAIGWRH